MRRQGKTKRTISFSRSALSAFLCVWFSHSTVPTSTTDSQDGHYPPCIDEEFDPSAHGHAHGHHGVHHQHSDDFDLDIDGDEDLECQFRLDITDDDHDQAAGGGGAGKGVGMGMGVGVGVGMEGYGRIEPPIYGGGGSEQDVYSDEGAAIDTTADPAAYQFSTSPLLSHCLDMIRKQSLSGVHFPPPSSSVPNAHKPPLPHPHAHAHHQLMRVDRVDG